MATKTELPLAGIRVVECATGVAAAYAGRLLTAMGAETVMVEPPGFSPLRQEPPFLGGARTGSALFAYLAAGKRSVVCDLRRGADREAFERLLAGADILIDDTPVGERCALGLDPERIESAHPRLVHLSVLPFGAAGPKAGWTGSEVNLIHAGGEGYLLPNGLTADLFPDRPPLKIGGHFAEMQGGVAGALGALSALWSGLGQFVDVSVQDANVAVSAFAVQRYGDGSVEHRRTRSFRYGGVIECADGYVELLTLEDRQWTALLDLLGHPDWATDPALADPAVRSARGDELNDHIRAWAKTRSVAELVTEAQALGVPMAPYNSPDQILDGTHETARGVFGRMDILGVGSCAIQAAPFRFAEAPLPPPDGVAAPGADQTMMTRGWLAMTEDVRRARA